MASDCLAAAEHHNMDSHIPLWRNCRLVEIIKALFFIKAKQGAQTILHCCLAHDIKGLTYYHNVSGEIKSAEVSYDEEKATAMWLLSERLTEAFQ